MDSFMRRRRRNRRDMIRDDPDAIACPEIRRPGGRLRRLPAARWRSRSCSSSSGRRIHGAGKASITTTTSGCCSRAESRFPRPTCRGATPTFWRPFYRLFGDRPWIPLVAQALLNGLLPWLVYAYARTEFDERTAVVAAVLTGIFSFNTVYASTQSSDSVCTVLFMAAIVTFVRGRRQSGSRWLAAQRPARRYRGPVPSEPAVGAAADGRRAGVRARRVCRTRRARCVTLLAMSGLVLMPWIVRNYRLTGEIIPTSTHGGVQLWYGTLQTGPYLQSRASQPALDLRSAGVRLHEPR